MIVQLLLFARTHARTHAPVDVLRDGQCVVPNVSGVDVRAVGLRAEPRHTEYRCGEHRIDAQQRYRHLFPQSVSILLQQMAAVAVRTL